MSDQSLEQLREYVNSYRSNKNFKMNAEIRVREHFSNDELISLLELDTFNVGECREAAQHRTEETVGNYVEGQNSSNFLKVLVNDVDGLNFELRESLYSKLSNALLVNYRTVLATEKSISLTESHICHIAKKMEYGILSSIKDLNSYKLSGTSAIVNIEKQTCNRTLCDPLINELELLRLRKEIETVASEALQRLPNISPAKSRFISLKESQFPDNHLSTKPMTVGTVIPKSVNLLASQDAVVSESEYFSCSPNETRDTSEICTINDNSQGPTIDALAENILEKVEMATDEKLLCTSFNDDDSVCNNRDDVESIDCQKNHDIEKSNCLINEEDFQLEQARLDKLYEELQQHSEESSVNVIHSDYQKIFDIIIPIIRQYYPSEFIPDELCYGHILQRLQIDLSDADMCDDDIALYIEDSIKTRRYLLDNCIVQ